MEGGGGGAYKIIELMTSAIANGLTVMASYLDTASGQ